MADKKISDFTAVTTLGASDLLEIETSGGNSRKITAANASIALAPALDDITDVNAPSPTDGQALVYDTGTSMWIPGSAGGGSAIFARTQPVIADFGTTIKTSGVTDSSADSADGHAVLNATKGSNWADDEGISRLMTLPSTTFTAILGFLPPPPSGTHIVNGLMIRDATNSKGLIVGSNGSATLQHRFSKFTAVNGTGATWTNSSDTSTAFSMPGAVWWAKMTGDGTNLKCYISSNKQNWYLLLNETFATFMTSPSQIGIGTYFRLASSFAPRTEFRQDWRMSVVHWSLT
jgi:hypothetical protein